MKPLLKKLTQTTRNGTERRKYSRRNPYDKVGIGTLDHPERRVGPIVTSEKETYWNMAGTFGFVEPRHTPKQTTRRTLKERRKSK